MDDSPLTPPSPPAPNRRLRVAIVAASLRILGGQAVQAEQLLEKWRNDPEIEAWLVPINPVPPPPFDKLLSVKFLRTVITQILYWPLLWREVARADLVHVFSASYSSFWLAPFPAVLIAKLLSRPVVLNYHSGEAPDHLRRSRLACRVMRWCDINVVPSSFLRDVLARFGIAASVVHNTIDLARFPYRVREPLRPRLLSTRNLEPLYNVACTLRAFARVQARLPDASLTVVGSGSQDAALRRLAENLGLRHVTFAGRVAPEQIPHYYADADVYVQTPSIDNLPLSVLEAFASGLPVVATAVGGVPTMLADGVHGRLARDGDDTQVADHLLALLNEPEYARQLAAAAHESCAKYEWPVVRAGWLDAYRAAHAHTRGDDAPATDARRSSLAARIARMGREELAWRTRVAIRTSLQRVAYRVRRPRWERSRLRAALSPPALDTAMRTAIDRRDWGTANGLLLDLLRSRPARFVLDPAAIRPIREAITSRWPEAAHDAAAIADRALRGEIELLGYSGLPVADDGGRIDWHRDPVHARRAPLLFWADVPYLDPAVGDHKIIWELNRHQHWLRLARAFVLTGDERYTRAIAAQLSQWLAANPPLAGINWASMLEIGFRAISWTWVLHVMLAEADARQADLKVGLSTTSDTDWARRAGKAGGEADLQAGPAHAGPWLVDMIVALDRQLTHLEQNLSYYFSPNTHLTGEALALYVVGSALPELAASERWRQTGRRILLREIERQVLPDGGHVERSTHYQRYTLDFYLLALATAERAGDADARDAFRDAVERLARFTRDLADDTGRLPLIGDDDGGRLWPLASRDANDVRDSLAVAAAYLGRDELAAWGASEEAVWLTGATVETMDDAAAERARPAQSRTLPHTGYVVLRDRVGGHLVFDAGRHGYMNGGHAHADALALTLASGARPCLVDPGTFTYTMDPLLRDLVRSSAHHNTLTIDGRSQSLPRGPFHWQTRTDARLHGSRHNGAFDWAEGSHDGYAPLHHRRSIVRVASGWLVLDEVIEATDGRDPAAHAVDRHTVTTHWHFDPGWMVTPHDDRALRAVHLDGDAVWLLHEGESVSLAHGDEDTHRGWFAPAYGTRVPAWSADVSVSTAAPASLATWIAVADTASPPSLERLAVSAAAPMRASALRVWRDDRADLLLLRPGTSGHAGANLYRAGACDTDARMLHVAAHGARVVALNLADGRHVRVMADQDIRIDAEEIVADLHVSIAQGELHLTSAHPPSRVHLAGGLVARARVARLNGRLVETRTVREGEGITLAAHLWTTPAPAVDNGTPATVRVTAHAVPQAFTREEGAM